jgi:putative ABC transport system permease protein
LRTLGASERQVRVILIVEYATLGALSALAGGLLATGAHFALARWMFHADFTLDLAPLLFAFAASTGASILAGVFISIGVCSQPPLKLLRQ